MQERPALRQRRPPPVGRTDLPTGDMQDLIESIRTKLYVLPDETEVYCGHGGSTSIGYEKKYNYFVHG